MTKLPQWGDPIKYADADIKPVTTDDMPNVKIGPEYYIGYLHNETWRTIDKLTWGQWFSMMWWRVQDAWLVLRGKAEIG